MLSLFRRVRKELLRSSSAKRYLLYAMGEIVLVVLGILIALQINNWNEWRKDLLKEQVILVQLKKDYEANLLQLEQKISSRRNIINTSQELLHQIDSLSPVLIDSINIKMGLIIDDPTFDPIQNDLFTSGNIRHIRNEELKSLLSNWSSDIIAVKELEELWSRKTHDMIIPYCINAGIGREVMNNLIYSWKEGNDKWLLDTSFMEELSIGNSSTPRKSLTKDEVKHLEGLLSSAVAYNYGTNLQSQSLKMRIQHILELLNTEIRE